MPEEIHIRNTSSTFEEVADYAERAVDYFISIGAEDKSFFQDGCQAIWQIATITIMLLQSKGGIPADGKFIINTFNILTCCQAILNLKEWYPDKRFPWTQSEMGKDFQKVYGDMFIPMLLEVTDIQKLMAQVSKPDPLIASS